MRRLQGGKVQFTREELRELVTLGLWEWDEAKDGEIPAEGMELYIRSTVCTFGNKRSVYIFTLVMRQPLRVWRSRGWRVGHLLDDFMFGCEGTCAEAQKMADQAVADLEWYGFMVNYEKSTLTPTRLLKWLGVLIDSTCMRFFVPPEKVV